MLPVSIIMTLSERAGAIKTAEKIDKKLKQLNKLVIEESTKDDEGYFLFQSK